MMGRHLSFAHCAANILVHISFADVRDFLQGMYAGVEWLGERVGPTFQGRLYQFTPSTSLVQCSCGIIFSPPFGILTLKFFFALNFIFGGKRSLGLHCLFFSPILHCLDYHRFIVLKSYIVSPSTLIFSSNTVSTILALPICFLASSYFAYNVASIQCFPSAICSISSSLSHKLFPSL